uniref:Dystonin n=1 Tax=Electrophorus electricus TaxID=8005 RepID=A0A4W4F3D0_ELEEL
ESYRVQKKTFTKWINQHLFKVRKHVNDLYEDLRDGHNLISLLEVLSEIICHDTIPVKLVNIRNDDITDGNPKLTLGLIWTIILHFQISDIHIPGESEDMTAKERLLLWSQQMTEGYVGVHCDNFTTSWRDGRLFNAIIHKYRPDLVDMSKVSTQNSRSNLEHAFSVAEQLGVARLLDPEDVDVTSPDEKSVITYVSTLYDVFPKVPEGVEGINANDVDVKWVEYQNMVNYLSQWIKHNVTVMSDRNFPSNPVELKALYSQYLHFKEREIPPKETEKTKIKHLYKMLEVWIEFGRIQLPQGYHPNDVEKEWGKLIVAMLEREKSLRPEVDRLEMLQQIANRVQRDCMTGEDKLALVRASLQSDAKRLESGIQFQHEAEIAGYLLESENLLRQQVVDIQILLDGKFYLADQLVQRVSKLRDDLLTLRAECSSVYSKGRILTQDQTKMMISGITQSLNSGFSQHLNAGLSPSLTPALTPGTMVTPGSTLAPALTPDMTPALTPGLQPILGGGGGMEPGVLQHLKQVQIRKPMLKSSLVDPNLSEEEVNMKFVQDLVNWVEEMQVQLDREEWGSDLPSVESHLENHRNIHKAIEDFQMSLKEAKISEIQMTQPLKQSYSEKLGNLENQYGKLLNFSRERQKHLESLHDFVSRATQELIWLNEKEEEEVAFDWSERNANISRKKNYHADLMRELDQKEGVIKSVQDQADSLLQQNHPARLTIEAYKAAMQTQWSWILQLCYCVEQHLKDNAAYFEFFNDAKESLDYLKSLQDSISRKYGCDRTSSLHKLEDLIQESMDEKEQLLQYRSTVAGVVGRAKSVCQLKPRNPESPVRMSVPVKAICDYCQIEITIYKDDECVLASNAHRAKWKVISPSGNEAMVPSVCFSVPPPNKEAIDMASRIEQLYQNVLALWHRSHINMKSVVSWHYLMMDIRTIRKSTVASIKTMLPGEHQQVLSSLHTHLEEFLEDSEESEVFTMVDCTQLEREVLASKEYYEELLKSAEREEHEESVYNLFISEVRNFRMCVEAHEEQLIRQVRTPLARDDLQASIQRIAEQERKKAELDRLKEDLEVLKEKCEVFLRQAANSPAMPTLSSELNILTQSMNQVYSMCSIYLEKLKTVSLVVKHSQSAEALVKLYEAKLCEEDAVHADIKSIDAVMSTLKRWRSEIDEKREVFHDLEDELQKARVISDRMFKTHNERDFDLDWHKEKAEQLGERWRNIHSQIENRLRDLEGISKSLKYYKDTYSSLDEWSKEMEANQLKTQENQPEDSKALAELLNQQKVLVGEIERKHSKIDECQKYAEQYAAGVKDYELQLMTYRAMVDSQHKSPVKRRRMQSSSDAIQQEFMDLRTRYTALVTLMTQYVKFASETLKRAEEDESFQQEKLHSEQKIKTLKNEIETAEAGLMAKTYAVEFLEAQAATGAIIDPTTGESYTSLDALDKGIISGSLRDKITDADKFQVIEGILDVRNGAVLSVCRSVQNGLIDQSTGLSLLEAQLITSDLILPELRMCLDLDDAFKHNLVEEPMYKQLHNLNKANKLIQDPRYTSEPLPVVAALKDGVISEHVAIKVIEIQLATGGLRLTYTGDSLSLEKAFQFGLIPHSLYIQVLERQNTWKDLIDPNTAEKVSLIQLVQRSIVHEETGLCLLAVKSGKDGTISLTSGRDVSILRAMHEGLIDRETALRLLSAQLFAGGIADPKTNHKLTVEEALSEGLIDQDTAIGILSHQVKNGGIVNPHKGDRLTVDEAVQCNLMSSQSALLVLERQKVFMGLLWPHSGEILTISTSLQHEIITDKIASELLCNRHNIAGFYIPENSKVVDIDSAAQDGLIDTCTKELLKTIEIPDMFPDEVNDRFSNWLVICKLQTEGSHRFSEKMEVDENSINTFEAKQLFISYLMKNSYMDPKSGQRLLIFDRKLNKMAKVLLEMPGVQDLNGPSNVKIHDYFLDKNILEDVHECLISHTGDMEKQEESDPQVSTECADVHKHCIISSTTESGNVTSNEIESSEIFYTSIDDKASVIETGSNKNTLEESMFKSSKYHANYVVNALAQPSLAKQILEPFCSESATETSLHQDHVDHTGKADQTEDKYHTNWCVMFSEKPESIEMPSEYPHSKVLWKNPKERTDTIHLLKTQLGEGRILDVTSAKRYDLKDDVKKGLIDEEIALDVLTLKRQQQGVEGNKSVSMSVQAMSQNSISSEEALQIRVQQNMVGDFYDSEKNISISKAWELGLITDVIGCSVLDSELVQKAIIDPEGKHVCSVSDTQLLHMLKDEKEMEVENLLQKEHDKDIDILMVDIADEKLGKKWQNTETALKTIAEATSLSENTKQPASSLHSSFSLKTVSDIPSKTIASISIDSVTENSIDQIVHTHGSQDFQNLDLENSLDTKYETHRNSTTFGKVMHKENENNAFSLNVATGASCRVPLVSVRDVVYGGEASNRMETPVQSDSGISCSSQSDIYSYERKSEISTNMGQQHYVLYESQQTRSTSVKEGCFDGLNTLNTTGHEDIKTLMDLQPSLSSRALFSESSEQRTEEKIILGLLEAQLAAFPGKLASDMELAEQLLKSDNELIPMQIQQDLDAVFVDLQNTFANVCQLSSERSNAILLAIDTVKSNLEYTYQDFLSSLDKMSSYIEDNYGMVCKLDIMNTDDLETVKYRIQQNKDLEKNLSGTRQHLEGIAFDIQYFISENTQFLSPAQNRQLLKSLSATQRKFKELMERVFTQRHILDLHLDIREDESRQQSAMDKQKEFVAKLQELCDDLTQTENHLIGHQQQASSAGKSLGDLQQYQQEHQALQKDIQANVSALNEVISGTKKFLEENLCKLTPEQIVAIELKLEEAKSKANMQHYYVSVRFGNLVNLVKYVKPDELFTLQAHHQEILSQQQDLIIATQSAQALLDKQAEVLSPSEKEKLQRDIQELRGRYEASLAQAEQQVKQVQSIQEELHKFQGDYNEFDVWLQQALEKLEELGLQQGTWMYCKISSRNRRAFMRIVISHKGDLRFITISGQKVLDVAEACSRHLGMCAAVKEKLDSTAARHFKNCPYYFFQCNLLGNNLKTVVEKYKKYDDTTRGLLTWLNNSEEEAIRQQSEPIMAEPQTLQRQLEETKALQGQTAGRQAAVETLRKTADALIATEGDLLSNKDDIQEAVDDIVERYDNLSKSVSDRNEKLQVTLTRSLSVQDGLDEMMNWMGKVEERLGEEAQVPLDSAMIADALSKVTALEQDMCSRQSSILAMKAKVEKFVETAEPAAAALLQAKMKGLSQRFSDAYEKHGLKILQMEQLKEKVEQFEKTSEKVQQFVMKRTQALSETNGPGKNVNELSQLVQDTNAELAEHAKDMETLQTLSDELSSLGPEGNKTVIQGKMANLSNMFNAFKDTVQEKEEEVSSCQDQLGEFKAAAGVLMKWLEETKEQVPVVQPNCSEQSLGKDLQKGLLEEWAAKASAVQDINSKGSALCSLISVLTSPGKAKMHHKSDGDRILSGSWLPAELMQVQQNMLCVGESYRNLGELLKTRSSELNAQLLKVQGAHDEAESMLQWLENMKKTATSWSSEPMGKESVKTQMEQQKSYEENMKQKEQQHQQLREKLLHLIEENPDSPEAAKWKHMLDQIDAGWKEVRGSVENRKQHLEESSRMLELFQTTQLQLFQWLQEKELMMSVLGPLSMEPNMLNTQKQQVEILLKEFESRKPQYEQLNEAAPAITSSSGQQDPAVEGVKDQLAAITQKWQSLTAQLSQRSVLIEQAVDKITQFLELLHSLGDSVVNLESQLNGQQALSTHPDVVKKQLEATYAIEAQLCEEKKRLKEAEGLCSELSALVTEEYLRANLKKQLENVSKPFKLLEDKRIHQLNSTFASSLQFHQTSKDFQAWIEQKLQDQAGLQTISAKVDILSQSLKEHSAVQRALSEHEEPYSTIIKEGETLLQSTEGAEKLALQGQLSALKSNWEEVKRGAVDRAEKLNTAIDRAQKYKEHAESLSKWLQDYVGRENMVKFSVNPAEVENCISQVKAIQKDLDKRRAQMELLNTAADSLMEVATADVDAVKEEKMVIGQNIENLTEDLQLKKESLEKLSQRLKEFTDTHKELKSQLEDAKRQLECHTDLGVQAYSNKNLTNMKAQQKSLENVQTQIEHLKSLAHVLVVDVPEAEGVTDVLLQADSLEKEHRTISKATEDTCSMLENKLKGIGQFQNTIREMFTSFTDLDDELDSMASMGRDIDTLRDQQGNMQSFVTKLQDLMTNTLSARDTCKKMLESETSPDLLGLKRDLEALSKQSGKLMDRANRRKEQVEDMLKHLEEFYNKLHTFKQSMVVAEEHEESLGPVGMETEVINQQLETFKVFQKDTIESLQTQLQELNSLGQGLIQNAPKGTVIKGLEHDLDEVNNKWNTINKKVAERSAQLHEALLHCGRFQDALESLLSWLTDTEELVASQKPPSAEFKVVKAQIQEQRLLQRLLDDRRPTVELIKKEGGKVTELADSVDKEKIGKEIECLGERWDALLKKAESRRKQLENILVVAQQFHETLEPLVEWLTATEKCLANSEPIGTQTSKLEEQISQNKTLEEEIISHSKSLYQVMSLGQELRTVSCMDDKELVQAKLDSTQSSYIKLQECCCRKAELLQQALSNAQLFGEDEVALMNWLDEIHGRLSEVMVQDYAPAMLAKQHAKQLVLHEDIVLRKQSVDQALQNGIELLKQTTGDEVVTIQGKLDGIKTRYAEITTMSNNVLKTLDKVLSLATSLQHTHEELNSWLEKVESELAVFRTQEQVGEQLTQVQVKQNALLKEVQECRPVVDMLNEVSSALLELVPWRAREGLDKLVTDDNERYRSASEAIARHVNQTGAAILKSQQFKQAADTELAWLTEAERKLTSLGDIKLEPEQTVDQLQAQKGFSMDIMRHKDAVDDITKTGDAIMSSKDEAEKQALKAKVQALLEKYNVVSHLNSERCLQLERAHSLVCQFWETYEELWPWLHETQANFTQLPQPAIEYETLRQQQEELRQLRELIAEHKPHIDKMNKTGPQLVGLSPVEGEKIRETYQATDKLYAQLKADVKQRATALDEAISKSTQFHDKIDPMLESLVRIAERLRQPPSISVEVEKIRDQISENKAVNMDLEKLQPSYETLKQRGEEMITRSEGADKDLSAKAVQDKLDQMVFVWNDIHALLEEREAKLLDVMDLAEKFWCDHCALIVTIKETQDLLKELEEPGVDPSVVKQQQESVEGYREEIDGLQEEVNVVQNLGAELMTACGEPDKPVIKKSIDEVNLAWETLNKTWKERVERLEEAMQTAVQFQDGLQGMFDWVDILESKLDSMSPVGTDLETVKQQIEELKEFKGEAYQLQIEMERLNHQAGLLLKKVLDEADRIAIQEPMNELKMLWDNLDEKVINRQHKLESALLALGQFQHALDELLAWLTHTEDLLSEQKKTSGDPKAIEIELAKHHVLQNDVLAHKSTVEAVNKAGGDLIESSAGEEASGLQSKLENLSQRWKRILEKTEQRRQLLDSALLQAQGFHGEIEDMQHWLKDTERQLLASKAVGGLPDTAREQLNTHLELCTAMEVKEEVYQQLLHRGQQLVSLMPESQDSTTELDLRNLQDKWECVQAKVAERKVKLEEALAMATDFHNSLQDFINWLTQAEQTLTMVSPASLILETILFQIDEHKVFVTEVNAHRDQIIELDKTGTHLKYFSQKQDVVLIKNLLISVQSRWEKVVQRSVERGRLLDDARKRAKQFHESWTKLMEWLEESERALDLEQEIANDPDKIKMQLGQHKVTRSQHTPSLRTWRKKKKKQTFPTSYQISELHICRNTLNHVWNKLEEALLFSGQFTDALQALIDWLYKVEPQLAEDQPVHGDIDLVLNLIDNHKVFQKELGKRTSSVQALKRSARELIENSHDDSSWVKVQMQELSTRWETVCALSVSKQTRLEQALCQAEEFHSTVHILLEWLAEAEQSLRFHGSLPDDEEALRNLIEQHKEFMKKLEEKRVALGKAISMGEAILAICHPDSITTIKHWNTIIKARFEEVTAWVRQHQQRLSTALSELLANQELLESLLSWLQWAETTLTEKDKDLLPQEIEKVKVLITEHQTFMEEMTRKQPDVDKVTKTHKRKATAEPPVQSQIPVLDKGRAGRKRSPTQAMYPPAAQPQIETKNPRVNLLVSKWQQVWLLALDRRRKLNDALDRLEELKEFANFDFDVWRKRYMRWMNHKKSRVMDFFRRIDKDQDGKVTRQEFIEGILSSKFPTSRLEMSAVADIFDRDGDGYIDYYEFVAALHPNKDAYKPLTDADKIEDEVTRQVAKCKCPKRFQVEQIGANKYRFYLGNQFGDSQQLRLVRILRSTVMVRVGGGWMALDEFLVKNDPCRAKGRTNIELREKFILPEGTTQVMASFRYRGRRSRPSSRGASPNRSNSSHSCPSQPNPASTSTPKTPQHLTRNYDKPWLTNSKSATPIKSTDSFESQGSSTESTPIQGSKLRLPGYLSGKGFQSGDDGTLINAAVLKARGQATGPGKIPSRPGSKAGSRGSSRRGSDASDFDISDIQSVCSDMSEAVTDSGRPIPRATSRQPGGKPSKIPTPQRRSTPTSKLAKTTKR